MIINNFVRRHSSGADCMICQLQHEHYLHVCVSACSFANSNGHSKQAHEHTWPVRRFSLGSFSSCLRRRRHTPSGSGVRRFRDWRSLLGDWCISTPWGIDCGAICDFFANPVFHHFLLYQVALGRRRQCLLRTTFRTHCTYTYTHLHKTHKRNDGSIHKTHKRNDGSIDDY